MQFSHQIPGDKTQTCEWNYFNFSKKRTALRDALVFLRRVKNSLNATTLTWWMATGKTFATFYNIQRIASAHHVVVDNTTGKTAFHEIGTRPSCRIMNITKLESKSRQLRASKSTYRRLVWVNLSTGHSDRWLVWPLGWLDWIPICCDLSGNIRQTQWGGRWKRWAKVPKRAHSCWFVDYCTANVPLSEFSVRTGRTLPICCGI